MKKILFICAVLLTPWLVSAQSEDGGPRPDGEKRAPHERMGHRRGGEYGFPRGEWLERLQSENPKEFERLQALRETDPEAFREEMRSRMKKRVEGFVQERSGKLDTEAKELGEKYRKAETEEQKAAIKAQLQAKVYEAFDTRLEGQKKLITHLEEQLERLKEQVAERENNRDTICRKRLDSLTEDPNLRW